MPELIDDFAFVSNVRHYIRGEHAPLIACIVQQWEHRSAEQKLWDIKLWRRAVFNSSSVGFVIEYANWPRIIRRDLSLL